MEEFCSLTRFLFNGTIHSENHGTYVLIYQGMHGPAQVCMAGKFLCQSLHSRRLYLIMKPWFKTKICKRKKGTQKR